ncbi:MAG: branched-chain amino acid aminotransferase [Bacteroidetes bacterium]|nr:branched-chain amino acid aminotransferase [Bacteroidota bacterium]MDA0902732.1 branched-chain amino acid aminotransferase [Bacteroidota bacterium]MDA1241813.1 branched-chain amino acid aminotransferase [Bacteroidota bacterium]
MQEWTTLDFDIKPTSTSRLGEVDFSNLIFGKVFSDHMFVMDFVDGEWQRGEISAFGPMTFSPAIMSLHYGQAIFEGMKAFRQPDGGVSLFRPGANIQRLNFSARRMSMPEVPEATFLQALMELMKLDSAWVPAIADSALYIRPFMFATESHVGVRPSLSYRFCIFTCPVAAYYTKPVRVKLELVYTRAAAGGTGAAKAAGNYAGSLYPTELAKAQGYDQLLWTDASTHTAVEECGTMNVAFVMDGVMVVPKTSETVLSGITRDSAIQLMEHHGVKVEQRRVTVEELQSAAQSGQLTEAFGLGTAATVSPICTLGLPSGDWDLPDLANWKIGPRVKSLLNDVRYGTGEDPLGWNIPV